MEMPGALRHIIRSGWWRDMVVVLVVDFEPGVG